MHFGPDLARSLNTLSNTLSDLGRFDQASVIAEELAAKCRAFAKLRPDVFNQDLALALNTFAISLLRLGRGNEAMSTAVEATELYRVLAKQNPSVQPNLAVALMVLADCLDAVGQHDEALAAN
jgi:tetratricopeptide (TPR) repeat protein